MGCGGEFATVLWKGGWGVLVGSAGSAFLQFMCSENSFFLEVKKKTLFTVLTRGVLPRVHTRSCVRLTHREGKPQGPGGSTWP